MLDRVREPVQQAVRPRLIPVLLLKHGVIVRSQLFKVHQVIGNPMSTVERLSQWNADELVVLDISRGEGGHDLRRDDLHQQYVGDSAIDVLREIAKCCFMPLTFGGRIRSLADIEARLAAGADKVAINTAAFDDPALVEAAARRFGVQCIVGSIDALRHDDGRYQAFVDGGRRPTGHDPAAWARELAARGAGEIFLNSIDRDGSAPAMTAN
jgi:imidazoleglycerol phosphate synthase cyclase subunit